MAMGDWLARIWLGPDTILYPLLHIRTTASFRYPIAVWQAGGCVLLPDDLEPRARDQAALSVFDADCGLAGPAWRAGAVVPRSIVNPSFFYSNH